MEYELVKQLIDKGFPQATMTAYIPRRILNNSLYSDPIGQPTLDQLIEECGYSRFNSLSTDPHKTEWRAVGKNDIKNNIATYGSTPEEAVAKLWLELNKK